jgi:two-component system sensor histidine kinase FlrB
MSNSALDLANLIPCGESSNDKTAELQSAFSLFNDVSGQLADTYREMEEKVSLLNDEMHLLAEQRLQELKEKERVTRRMESLLKLLPAGVVVLDSSGKIIECNPAAIDLLGEPLEGQLWRDVIARSFAPRNDDGHEISLRDGRRISLATRSFDGEEGGQLLLLTDLTETRELQQRLSRHQRLSEMGKMMSSLAHQIRTPLSAAMLYAGHLCDSELNREQSQRFSNKILSRLTHMEQQIKGMLIFIKGDVKLGDTMTMAALVSDLEAAMEAPVHGSGSICHIENHCPDALIRCNRDSMVGALMNLVTNAIQAVGSGVQICIDIREQSDGVELSIADNGPGMSEQQIENIQEPFFTTKAQGTGLGLAVVRAVVKAHRGAFRIESSAGEGTTAKLLLPVINQAFQAVSDPVGEVV